MSTVQRLLPLLLAAATLPSLAQQPPGISQSLNALADQPATHTSFTFDRSMLNSAESLIDDRSEAARRVIASIDAITVETFHYARPAFYAPEAMDSITAIYNAAGWKHLVNANSGGNSAQPRSMITDLWLHFHGAQIDDVTVLVRAPRDMNLIQLSGSLRPLDLVHLSGHFGIPKVDPDAVMVPAPPGR